MTKNIDQEQREQEFRNRINENAKKAAAKMQEQFNEAFSKAAEAAKKDRKRKLAREAINCFLAAAGIAGLGAADAAGLISPVLTAPVLAIALVYIGWHLCKFDRLWGRK